MTDVDYFNDEAISTPEEDRFGVNPFAQALATSIKEIKAPVGTTIAINGKWGSGKSSTVNLIRYHLADTVTSEHLKIIDFKCWWFRGEEALTLAFLQELNAELEKTLGKKGKELIPKLGKALLRTGPVVGPAMNLATGGLLGSITGGAMDVAKDLFPPGETVEEVFRQLAEALYGQ